MRLPALIGFLSGKLSHQEHDTFAFAVAFNDGAFCR